MFKLNLILHRKSENIMIFSPAFWFRFLFLFLLVVIIIGITAIINDDTGNELMIIPILIGVVCFFAAFYEESWCFDRERRIIVTKFGLIFLHRKKIISFAEIENFELLSFLRGVEADKSADKEINLIKPFSKDATAEISGKDKKIIHNRRHQELILCLRSGARKTIEVIDSKNSETLKNKAGILADFCGIPLVQK